MLYVKVHDIKRDKCLILSKERLNHYYKEGEYTLLSSFEGSALLGKHYHPPFPYFLSHQKEHAFKVIRAEEIATQEGTGIVHAAPAFGEADFFACQKAGISPVCPVDNNGLFTTEASDFQGLQVKEADKEIIRRLKEKGLVFKQETIRHRYPFCPRSDTPLIYKTVHTWFVAVEEIRDRLAQANMQIHWTPDHLKHGRFGKWLAQARDWNIARNRYWGTPIPLWKSTEGDLLCIGSIAELETLTQTRVVNLHRQHIDPLTILKDGKVYRRIPEVFDCWFESGSMPYAQNHYPFENREQTDRVHPADFIAEGLDQTRGWFYTLTILSTLLFGQPAFKNAIVNGLILAEDGQKMSKRLKNYPDPSDLIAKYGADAIRLYMLHSPAMHAEDLRFSERGVELVLRQILIPLWNSYSFFVTYANIYSWKADGCPSLKKTIDRWMVSLLHRLIEDVEKAMDSYELAKAVEPFVAMVDQLTNWYIRLNRRRFWEFEESSQEAFYTLYTVLLTLSQIAAPFIPFFSEMLYRGLKQPHLPCSVHLCNYPKSDPRLREVALEAQMEAVQTVATLGHALRKEYKIKVRQPLLSIHIASGNPQILEFLNDQKDLIAQELNVKEVHFNQNEQELVQLRAKPNFRTLGKKVGPLMKKVQQKIQEFSQKELALLRLGKEVAINIDDQQILLYPEDIEIERTVREGMPAANSGEITLILDTTLNHELLLEGLARELVNKVSMKRRELDLSYTQRIELTLDTTARIKEAFEKHEAYIKNELLAVKVTFAKNSGEEWDLNGENCILSLHPV